MKKIPLLILLMSLVVVLGFAFRKDHTLTTVDARQRYETPHSHYFEWRDALIHYTDQGEGVPVILIHGYAGSYDNWSDLVHAFPDGYRLIAIDLPGLGLSDFPTVGEDVQYIELYADMMKTLMGSLALDSVYLIGNSLGGYLAWETAVRYPERVRKLVLLNAAGYSVEEISSFFIKLSQTKVFDVIKNKGVPRIIVKQAALHCLGDDELGKDRDLSTTYGLINKKESLETITRLGSSGQYPDSTRISLVKSPTLIVWGDKDAVIPVEHAYKFERDIPGSRLLIYEGSGHVPMIENTERLLNDLLDFFDKDRETAKMDS